MLKLLYFGHLMQRTDSLETPLCWERLKAGEKGTTVDKMLDGITNSMGMSLGKFCELVGEGNGNPLHYSCLENPLDRGAWQATVHEVTKSWTRLSDFTFTFHFHELEKEMATHSSILAWRIPGTEEPVGLLSMGSQRVGHN